MSTLSTYTLLLSYYWLQKQGDPVYKKILHEQLPKVLLLETFGGPGLTWSDLWKNRTFKQTESNRLRAGCMNDT